MIATTAFLLQVVALKWTMLAVRAGETAVRLGLFRAEKPAETACQTGGGAQIDASLARCTLLVKIPFATLTGIHQTAGGNSF
eukprot:SAG11_NODE_4156_length_2034_cov_2.781395_3_plen_82_part_00